jgi:transposase
MQKRVYAKRTLEGIEVAAWSERAGQDVVVGGDVSKATLELVIRWAGRAFERPITVPNPGGIPEALTRLRLLHEGRALKVALEPSGTYGDAFRQACHDADLTVWRVRPKAAHDYAEVFDGVPSPHDGKDGAIIAELAAIGKAEVWPYAAERESDQRLKMAADLMEAYARQLAAWNGRIEGWLAPRQARAVLSAHEKRPLSRGIL